MLPPELMNLISKLTPEQLDELIARSKAFRSLPGGAIPIAPVFDDSDEHLLLDCIEQVARARTGGSLPPSILIKRASRNFRLILPRLVRYVEAAVGKERRNRAAFLLMALHLLADDLDLLHLPITSTTLLRHVGRLPAVVARAFPGYYHAGLLRHVITREIEDVREKPSQPSVPAR